MSRKKTIAIFLSLALAFSFTISLYSTTSDGYLLTPDSYSRFDCNSSIIDSSLDEPIESNNLCENDDLLMPCESTTTLTYDFAEPLPFEPNEELGLVYARLVSVFCETPLVSYFNEETGRVSHFNMQGESKGFRYVDSIDYFWAMVDANAEATRQSRSSNGIPNEGFFSVGYHTMEVIHVNRYGEGQEFYFDTVEEFESFLTEHNLQSLAEWQREQEEIEYLLETQMRRLGFESLEEVYAAFDAALEVALEAKTEVIFE